MYTVGRLRIKRRVFSSTQFELRFSENRKSPESRNQNDFIPRVDA